ncbi:VIT domain-containing protein [Aggregatilinea lenta]|uniref:VIT domain-containing protein n=1 Tax=Aggregatilinea lenta TaxID=913108 RepID=UPI0013C37853|nr:VIT domain-containing protein [Aggregatilinea lenta]
MNAYRTMLRPLTLLVVIALLVVGAAPALAASATLSPDALPFFTEPGVLLRVHRASVTVEDQVATTRVEQVFYNDGARPAEGTYLFPLPVGAAVSNLIMYVDGQPVEAKILDAETARAIYDEIVRQMRDPALLEYVGAGAIQASVFPIQPNDEVKIEIEYGQLLPVENGLVHYEYPLRTDQYTRRPVGSLSINVQVESSDAIGAIYSPSHNLAIVRDGSFAFRAGYEASQERPDADFSLYYGLASDEISTNLLTYRESANEDGFFTLMITPPVSVENDRVLYKDVIVVLDQSGSMFGDKWDQAREAVKFVLDHLNEGDRFNVIVFSTGYRIFATDLQPAAEADEAKDWIDGLEANGGTDINAALLAAMEMADRERQAVVLFLTDGLPTEGETNAGAILDNVEAAAPPNARIFTFGVGDDVDTFLLDQLYQAFRGAGTYVRPDERIDEEVSTLYGKISAPVLTNIKLEVDGVLVEDMIPASPLPDLFAGSQLIIAGRYRDGGSATVRLSGEVNGTQQVYTTEVTFPDHAGGEVFIPRLWATRKIGVLLNAIRLNGENPELVDSIVRLSIRYGIITPYTSFLIQEQDIFTQTGVEEAQTTFQGEADMAFSQASGSVAVDAAESAAGLSAAEAPMAAPTMNAMREGEDGFAVENAAASPDGQVMRYAGDRTFVWRDGAWIDTLYDADSMTPQAVTFLSDAYFDLLDLDPAVGELLALGDHVLFVWDGQAYEVTPE